MNIQKLQKLVKSYNTISLTVSSSLQNLTCFHVKFRDSIRLFPISLQRMAYICLVQRCICTLTLTTPQLYIMQCCSFGTIHDKKCSTLKETSHIQTQPLSLLQLPGNRNLYFSALFNKYDGRCTAE